MIFRSQVYGMFDIWSTLSSCAYQVLRGGETTVMSSQYLRLSTAFQAGEKTDQLLAARGIMVLTSVPSKLRSTTRQFAQCYLILAHFKHSKFHAVYIHIYIYPDPSPGFSSRGEPKTRRGGHIFKIQYWIYVATGGPNVKWGGTDFKCGGRAPLPPPLATTLCISHSPFNVGNASLFVCLHGYAVACASCATKQTFARCRLFFEGTLVLT